MSPKKLLPLDQPVRIAIVGCGRISQNHVKAVFSNYPNAILTALCDIEPEQVKSLRGICEEQAKIFDVKHYSAPASYNSYEQLLEDSANGAINIDLVVLCTPSGLHSSQAILAAKNKLHVCTEKPMATNWEDGLNMLDACNSNDVQLFVVKQNRFNHTLQLLKKQIDNKRFGKIVMVNVNVFWHRPQGYYDQADWRGTLSMDGGALMNQASHYIDLLDWLIGPVRNLYALTKTRLRDIEAEDTACLSVEWESEAVGSVNVTMLTYPENLEGSITILGEKGSVKVGGNAVNRIDLWRFESQSQDDKEVDSAGYTTNSVYGFGHPKYYANMINALKGIENAMCLGEDGLKSLELLSAAYQSAKSNKPVSLPLSRVK